MVSTQAWCSETRPNQRLPLTLDRGWGGVQTETPLWVSPQTNSTSQYAHGGQHCLPAELGLKIHWSDIEMHVAPDRSRNIQRWNFPPTLIFPINVSGEFLWSPHDPDVTIFNPGSRCPLTRLTWHLNCSSYTSHDKRGVMWWSDQFVFQFHHLYLIYLPFLVFVSHLVPPQKTPANRNANRQPMQSENLGWTVDFLQACVPYLVFVGCTVQAACFFSSHSPSEWCLLYRQRQRNRQTERREGDREMSH